MNMKKRPGAQDVYDTELNCPTCSARLYVPENQVARLFDSLKQTGLAGLLCVCGQVQIIGPDFKPIQPQPQERND